MQVYSFLRAWLQYKDDLEASAPEQTPNYNKKASSAPNAAPILAPASLPLDNSSNDSSEETDAHTQIDPVADPPNEQAVGRGTPVLNGTDLNAYSGPRHESRAARAPKQVSYGGLITPPPGKTVLPPGPEPTAWENHVELLRGVLLPFRLPSVHRLAVVMIGALLGARCYSYSMCQLH
jgi:hypothetical protein